MSKIKNYYIKQIVFTLSLLFLVNISASFAQNDFQKSFSFSDSFRFITGIEETDEGNFLILGVISNSSNIYENVFNALIDSSGNCINIKISNYNSTTELTSGIEKTLENNFFFLQTNIYVPRCLLTKTNNLGEITWLFNLPQIENEPFLQMGFCVEENSENSFIAFGKEDGINLFSVLGNGEFNFGKKLIPNLEGENLDYKTVSIKQINNMLWIAGWIENHNVHPRTGFLTQLTNEGNLLKFFTIPNFQINSITNFQNNDLLIAGNIELTGTFLGGTGKTVLMRITEKGSILWSKEYDLTNFGNIQPNIDLDVNENIIMFNSHLFNKSKTSIIKLTANGDPLWSYAYNGISSNITNSFKLTEDGGIIFAGFYRNEEGIGEFNKLLLTKIKADGTLTNNNHREICLSPPTDINFIIELNDCIVLDTLNGEPFYSPEITTSNLQVETLPEFIPPTPNFTLPQKLCIDQCTVVTGLDNENADLTEWTIENGIPEISSNRDPGQICFQSPGIFTVQQRITFDNCEYFYERTIEIVEDLEVELGEDQSICPDDNLILDATTPSATNYQWSNGNNTATSEILQSGQYFVTVSNEECEAMDSIYIFNVADSLTEYPIVLPEDTLLCLQRFPLDIQADFLLFDNIIWESGDTLPTFRIREEGIYTAQTEVGGCLFSDSILVESFDCDTPVYLPNAFSPNNDGVNDLFAPLGENFELLEISIYSRWGELIFQSTESSAAWDGHYKGKLLDQGVFVYVVRYQNLLLEEEHSVFGDLSLFW